MIPFHKIKSVTTVLPLSFILCFTACTPQEQALASGAVVGVTATSLYYNNNHPYAYGGYYHPYRYRHTYHRHNQPNRYRYTNGHLYHAHGNYRKHIYKHHPHRGIYNNNMIRRHR